MLERIIWKIWLKRGLLAYLLRPLAWLYGSLLNFRFGLYMMGYKRQYRAPVPVIVVGNIFIGGTGKTPMVIKLIELLRLHGWNPGVISRGYGSDRDDVREVTSSSLAAEVGDEPLLIAQHTDCPLFVSRSRALAAQELLKRHPSVDLLISDDGLQHYALARDIEIVMYDQRGIGNGFLLPAGPLRETAKRRRDFTVLNLGSDPLLQNAPTGLGDHVVHMRLLTSQLFCLSRPEQQTEIASLRGKSILAAAGIGNPQRFFDLLTQAGLSFEALPLPDHHVFDEQVFAQKTAEIILITEKDAVKCRQIAGLRQDPRIWVVPVQAHLEEHFGVELLKLLSEKKHGLAST